MQRGCAEHTSVAMGMASVYANLFRRVRTDDDSRLVRDIRARFCAELAALETAGICLGDVGVAIAVGEEPSGKGRGLLMRTRFYFIRECHLLVFAEVFCVRCGSGPADWPLGS